MLIPLAKQALTLSSAQTTLEDWRHTLAAQESAVAGYLGLHVGFLLAWVAAVLIISEIWRRAILRYLPDSKRRRPFVVLRRLVVDRSPWRWWSFSASSRRSARSPPTRGS